MTTRTIHIRSLTGELRPGVRDLQIPYLGQRMIPYRTLKAIVRLMEEVAEPEECYLDCEERA